MLSAPGALLVVLALAACDNDQVASDVAVWPNLSVGRIEPGLVLPHTRLRIFARGLVPEAVASYRVAIAGRVGGVDVAFESAAQRLNDELLEVWLSGALTDPLRDESGFFSGVVTLTRTPLDPTAAAGAESSTSRPFELPLRRTLTPTATSLSTTQLYLGDDLVFSGDNFLLPNEGTTLVRFDGVFESADGARQVDDLVVPGVTVSGADMADPSRPLARTTLSFALTPDLFGIRPGRFQGQIRVVNVHADATMTTSDPVEPGPLSLRAPVLSSITPTSASRGQIITVVGRGLLPADGLAQTATVLLLEGVFSPRRGVPQSFDGVSAIVVYPEISDAGRRATAVLRVVVQEDGTLAGLGAVAGDFSGTLTPLVLAGPDAVEGAPLPLDFHVLAPRQVVHIRFLPGFSDALVRFGLLAERGAIESRIKQVVERDFAGVNVTFTYTAPTEFAEYSVVEVGGYDPNGTHLFGLDNTTGKDIGNLRFDDVIGGFNAETREQNFAAYGGIFAAELLNLSPSIGRNELASPRFDDIFGDVVPELGGTPARFGESSRVDGRGLAVALAAQTLGNLIGSTITHEVGHSLGLAAIDGRYHNEGDNPGWIMDSGQYRPFEERAEIDGSGPAVFSPLNRDYLESILPRDDAGGVGGAP